MRLEEPLFISLSFDGEIRLIYSGSSKITYETSYGDGNQARISKIGQLEILYHYDLERAGNIASIGNLEFNYFDQYIGDISAKRVSQIDTWQIDYFVEESEFGRVGKISSINDLKMDYLRSYDNRGKISHIGGKHIKYFMENKNDGRSGKVFSISGEQDDVDILLSL